MSEVRFFNGFLFFLATFFYRYSPKVSVLVVFSTRPLTLQRIHQSLTVD